MKIYHVKHYQANKKYYQDKAAKRKRELNIWFKELKSKLKCGKCPENDSICLDFHHRNPKEKKFIILHMVRDGFSKSMILEEIAKCDVLCANCHRKHHRDEFMLAQV